MDGLLVDLRDNVSITLYFDFTYSGLYRCIVFFLLIVSLLHYLAIQPSRLQVCFNKISCQLHRATCRRFDTIQACDRQMDGRMELP